MNQASRIRLAKQLLHCARMVLDADDIEREYIATKNYKTTKKNFETIRQQLIELILQTFNSSTSSQITNAPLDIRKFCNQHNLQGKLDYHHFHGINNIPISSFINTKNVAKTAQEIVDLNVVPNMKTIDDIYQLNNSNQENFLWSVLRVELKSCYEHMKDQMQSKNNPFTWEQQIETLGDIYNPIDFFEHLSAVIMNYRVQKENINSLKEIIVKYLSSLKNIPKK